MSASDKTLAALLRESRSYMLYWPRTLRLIWTAAPRWTAAWSVLLVVQGILPVATVYLTKMLVDSLVAARDTGGAKRSVSMALVLLIITAGVMLLADVLQSVVDWVRTAQSELVQDHIKGLVHKQSTTLDMSFYEMPQYFDLLEQARSEASSRPIALLESCGSLVQNSITLVAMAVVLVSYSVWLPLILFVSTIPAFYVVLRFDRQYHRWWQRMTVDRRWSQYFDAVLTHPDSAAEVRLFGLGSYFIPAYQKLRRRLVTERLKQMGKLTLSKSAACAAALLVSGATITWMAWRALHGLATLGDLALFYQAFNRGQGLMRSLLGSVGQLITNSLYLGNLFAYLELKPQIKEPVKAKPAPAMLKKGIEFRNVTFTYPGSQRPALQNFSFFIPANRIVALVGVNGAGKSTLLKLLCRFYDPQTGQIRIDGTDLREFATQDLWRMMTVLFQFPVQYHASARQNIALGNPDAAARDGEVEAAARRAGAHELIAQLPEGYDSVLGRWFINGAQLSGGEWQRIALARAYVRRSPIILLDEPTSFMDSWAEADWFKRFRELAEGRAGVIITHRFTIAMRADIIHVMHEGEIVESGTHQELLVRGGLYAQSWKTQMQAAGSGQANDTEAVETLFAEDLKLAHAGS